jgi:predicted amidohydrolase YtcJ
MRVFVPIAALFISAAAAAAPDLIVINGDVHTVDSGSPRIEAFAIEGGRFTAIGSSKEIRSLADAGTQVIDAGGNTVVPGFIDSHSHTTGDSPAVAGVDLSYIEDKEAWLQLIAAADATMAPGEWMVGGYWDHTLSDGRFPTRQMLDTVVTERPVLLRHIDGHYSWANSKALEIAGITADTPVPAGGEILLDPETGEPTGILLEGAQSLVRNFIPTRTDAQRRQGLADMHRYANSFGVTGLHQMGALDDYVYLVEQGEPSLRVWYGQRAPVGPRESYTDDARELKATQTSINNRVTATGREETMGPLLRVGFVKLINDGVLSAHTAVMLQDYADRGGWRGEYITSPEELKAQVAAMTAAGLPVAVHSIGDAAVKATLDAFAAAADNPVPFPNRIEHIEVISPSDVGRFRQLGIAASMQPNHATNAIGYVPDRVGPEREANAYVWRSMLEEEVNLVFGADYPTSPLSPLIQIADATLRVSPFGFNDGKSWHAEQTVTFAEALRAYTQAGANLTPWKNEIGSISVGKWADFVMLDGKVPEPINDSFRGLSVQTTYFAGRQVYAK